MYTKSGMLFLTAFWEGEVSVLEIQKLVYQLSIYYVKNFIQFILLSSCNWIYEVGTTTNKMQDLFNI